MRGRLAILLVVVVALGAPAVAGAANASLPDIEDEVMCPICGTLLELSDSPQAERERAFIRTRVDQGQSKEEIKDALVAEYGPNVLATPDDSGFDLSAWVVPVVGLLAFAGGLGVVWWRRGRPGVHRADREPAPISSEDAARLERDMSAHEL
jgi:cytochrome c-type biogenesis protein CcmH